MPISMVYPTSRHLSLTVRVFVDWTTELFRNSTLLAAPLPVRSDRGASMCEDTSSYLAAQDANAVVV
jgi:hypothetical protein